MAIAPLLPHTFFHITLVKWCCHIYFLQGFMENCIRGTGISFSYICFNSSAHQISQQKDYYI